MKSPKVLCILFVVAVVIGACAPAPAPAPAAKPAEATVAQATTAPAAAEPTAAPTAGKKCSVAAVAFYSDSFMQTLKAGMEKAAAETGCDFGWYVSDQDLAKEASIIDDLITKKYDAIMITPVSTDGSNAAVKKAYDAGLKIICWNTCIQDQELVSSFIYTEGKAHAMPTGKAAAQYIKDNLGGKAKIGILNCEVYELCVDRKTGFMNELKDLQIEVVANQQGFEADKAQGTAEAMIQAHPEMDLIFAENEGGTTGAVQAVKTQGKAGKLPVFGLDMNIPMADMLVSPDNILQATTGQAPYEMGYVVVNKTKDILDGKPVDKVIFSPTIFFKQGDAEKVKQWLDVKGQAIFK